MKNGEIISAFVETLLQAPELTVLAVNRQLEKTRFEMKLLKTEPFIEFDVQPDHPFLWPMETAEKGVTLR